MPNVDDPSEDRASGDHPAGCARRWLEEFGAATGRKWSAKSRATTTAVLIRATCYPHFPVPLFGSFEAAEMLNSP